MRLLFVNLNILLTWGPHTVYHVVVTYNLYLYDQMWLVGILPYNIAI